MTRMEIVTPAFDNPARCADRSVITLADVDRLFFGTHHPSTAIAICDSCPAKTECLDWATTHRIYDGVWGGEGQGARRSRLGMSQPEPSEGGPRPRTVQSGEMWDDIAGEPG